MWSTRVAGVEPTAMEKRGEGLKLRVLSAKSNPGLDTNALLRKGKSGRPFRGAVTTPHQLDGPFKSTRGPRCGHQIFGVTMNGGRRTHSLLVRQQ